MKTRAVHSATSTGFPPIAAPDARLLILGTLPSRRSLEEREYYAHPRNAFWRIMEEIAGVSGDYADRCRALADGGFAVWDVLRSSVRPGSLDAEIRMKSARPNDFAGFFASHPHIDVVCFNGRKAEELFRRLVLPGLDGPSRDLRSLPSTSPAHAAMTFDSKLAIWRSMLALQRDAKGTP